MAKEEERIISRDCQATVVPSGEAVTLPEGSKVNITHQLGGNFTVVWDYGMARIERENADALGEEVQATPAQANRSVEHQGPPDESALWEQLKTVFDPEIPVNIVDLGLVYSLNVKEEENDNYNVNVTMTLTAPGCGMGPVIAEDAKSKMCDVPGVGEANVELVWDPPWNQDMISEEGKMQLGLI